ncbi:MAG: NAD(+)/NADH kinase [archaeon]|nr:NAD(+)/NADH kinase [archaeon]
MIQILRKIADEVAKAITSIPDDVDVGKEVCIGADGTPTGKIDKIAENAVLRYIAANNIQLNVLSEEIGYVDNGGTETLVLDPIDGSTNFIAGIPLYTISMAIGKCSLNSVHVAYVRNLATGEEFTAEKGKGAFHNGKKITVSKAFDPKKAKIIIHLGSGATPFAYSISKRIRSTRDLGCTSLEMIYVAQGSIDGCLMDLGDYEHSIRIVDIAASTLILREAGGQVFTLDGVPLDMPFNLSHRSSFLATSNSSVYDFVMNSNFTLKKVPSKVRYGISANMTISSVINIARKVIEILGDQEYVLDEDLAQSLGMKGLPIYKMDIDILIVIGGDGTILRTLQNTNVAIIGINAGDVGFLAEIDMENIESGIQRLIKGNYTIQKREKITTMINGNILGDALNEVVVYTDSIAKIRQFKIYVNDSFSSNVRSDGILLSTPTGSTSYAMNLGGPIIDYKVDAWLMIPMAAFKFSSSQMVIPASTKVTVETVLNEGCIVVIDGQKEIHIPGGTKIDMIRSINPATFIIFNTDFYRRVKDKLERRQ